MTIEQLRIASGIDKTVLDGLMALWKAGGRLTESNQRFAAPGHKAAFAGEEARLAGVIEALFRDAPFQPPGADEVVAKTGAPPATVQKILKILREHKRLIAVEDLLFHGEAIERAKQILVDHIRKEGKLDSVQFKYLLNNTRKHAIPLLDYFDRVGVTRKAGHTRFLK